jgi:hypothetical protein
MKQLTSSPYTDAYIYEPVSLRLLFVEKYCLDIQMLRIQVWVELFPCNYTTAVIISDLSKKSNVTSQRLLTSRFCCPNSQIFHSTHQTRHRSANKTKSVNKIHPHNHIRSVNSGTEQDLTAETKRTQTV